MLLYGRCFPESVTREAVLNVPQGTKEKYLAKSGWRDFLTINETISTTVKALSSGKDKHSDYYDLNGYRKQGRPETRMKGINIIRQSDGTVKKRIILE